MVNDISLIITSERNWVVVVLYANLMFKKAHEIMALEVNS